MGRGPKMGELKRAARQLGISSSILREQGWKTASPDRIKAVEDNPPEWLVVARERRQVKRARQRRLRDRRNTAVRLGIQARAVQERDVKPGEVDDLLLAVPDWLVAEQKRRRVQVEREAKDRLRRELVEALVGSVHEVWFQELKYATGDAEMVAIDARWRPEIDRAEQEARHLVDVLTVEQVRARIDREREAAREAGVYRAIAIARRAFGGECG